MTYNASVGRGSLYNYYNMQVGFYYNFTSARAHIIIIIKYTVKLLVQYCCYGYAAATAAMFVQITDK